MLPVTIFLSAIVFLYGIVVGSFLNVCIYRIPKKESIVSTPSHCMSCGYRLKWYDLIPVFSFLLLRGRCRQCKTKLSIQYPLIETINGIGWVLCFLLCGFEWETLLACGLFSALLVLTLIDWRFFEIPFGINLLIAILGLIRLFLHLDRWLEFVCGFFCISGLLLLVYFLTKRRGIGGGDIKLMAAAGLFLGWKAIIIAFLFGSFYACLIHIIRMKLSGADSKLAFGPYLSAGILTALWFSAPILNWYTTLFQ